MYAVHINISSISIKIHRQLLRGLIGHNGEEYRDWGVEKDNGRLQGSKQTTRKDKERYIGTEWDVKLNGKYEIRITKKVDLHKIYKSMYEKVVKKMHQYKENHLEIR